MILDAPQITIAPQSPYIIKVGDTGILYCKANGNPIPLVQWYTGNIAVNPVASPFQNYFLVPTNAPHTTVYTCKGTNNAGNMKHTAHGNITVIIEFEGSYV